MPAASRADGGQAFGEVETGVVYGWDQFPFSDFETPQSVPDEEFAPVGRSFGPANGVSDERLQVRQAHQRGFEHPGDAIADGVAAFSNSARHSAWAAQPCRTISRGESSSPSPRL